VLFVILAVLALTLPVPYVILSPGPTLNTLGNDDQGHPIITLKGTQPRPTTGHLNLTTVDIGSRKVTVVAALSGWLEHDKVVVPHDSIYPPGKSEQQTNQQDAQDFVDSQTSAGDAAFCELGYPRGLEVVDITTGSKAKGLLQPGDALVSFNGDALASESQLTTLLAAATPGTNASVVVGRAGKKLTVSVPLVSAVGGKQGARMGISLRSGCIAPFQIDLGLANEIGGPSAGLMFALGIIDKVHTDLTGGAFIAGTGTIDATGEVGPIGGIQLKMIAARRAGATIFLAPAGNCTDVRRATPKGLGVVKVDTLHDAVAYLLDIEQGTPVPHC
jgi:Lon-like protease